MPTECDGGIVRVREECVLNDDTSTTTCTECLDEVLEKEKGSLPCFDREVLLYLGSDFSPEWRIGKDNIVTIFFFDIVDILT